MNAICFQDKVSSSAILTTLSGTKMQISDATNGADLTGSRGLDADRRELPVTALQAQPHVSAVCKHNDLPTFDFVCAQDARLQNCALLRINARVRTLNRKSPQKDDDVHAYSHKADCNQCAKCQHALVRDYCNNSQHTRVRETTASISSEDNGGDTDLDPRPCPVRCSHL